MEVGNDAFSEFQSQGSFAVCEDTAEEELPGILQAEEPAE